MAENTVVKATDDRSQDFSKDENEERGNWTGRMDFLISCLGYAVGLGNVWRFPYLCYRNGGGVFLIPYCIMLFLLGMPIFFLELSLGQYTSRGALECWQFAPIFKGVGVAMVVVTSLVAIYYNMIIGWCFYYLYASFAKEMPWKKCGDWAGPYCRDNLPIMNGTDCLSKGYALFKNNGTCYNTTSNSLQAIFNTSLAAAAGIKRVAPSEEYFNNVILGINNTSRIMEVGELRWPLCLALGISWLIIFLSLSNGVKSSGKVVYFTAIFPYVVLVILLCYGLTLDGYEEGIKFYLTPDLSKLKEAKVWKDAAVQIFFSLGTSFGVLISMASYNRFHNNALRDAIVVSLGNCLTSFLAGFVIFSFLGFLSKELQVPVSEVATDGTGLAFVVYPDALTRLPLETLWSILFFIMLITLGLDSEFGFVETVTTAIMDSFPRLHKKKAIVTLGVTVLFFALGLLLCTDGGLYWLHLMDTYAGGWNVLLIAIVECLSVMFVYGVRRFREDVRVMLGDSVCCLPWSCCSVWWLSCWVFFSPLLALFILIFSWVDYTPVTFNKVEYPLWGEALGWLMTIFVVACIFFTAFYQFLVAEGGCGKRFETLFNPTVRWGPALPKHRALITHYNIVVDPDDQLKGMELTGS